jgi:hypothetical protein
MALALCQCSVQLPNVPKTLVYGFLFSCKALRFLGALIFQYMEYILIDVDGKHYTQILYADRTGIRLGQPVMAGHLWSTRIQPGESQSWLIAVDLPPDVRQPGWLSPRGSGRYR